MGGSIVDLRPQVKALYGHMPWSQNVKRSKMNDFDAVVRSTKRTADTAFSKWLYKVVNEGDELTPLRLLVDETIRHLSTASLAKLERRAIEDLTELLAKLGDFVRLFENEVTTDQEIWAAVPEAQKQQFYVASTELWKAVLVISSGGLWCGVDGEMPDSVGHVNVELQRLHEAYLYFAVDAESV